MSPSRPILKENMKVSRCTILHVYYKDVLMHVTYIYFFLEFTLISFFLHCNEDRYTESESEILACSPQSRAHEKKFFFF